MKEFKRAANFQKYTQIFKYMYVLSVLSTEATLVSTKVHTEILTQEYDIKHFDK